MSEFRDILVPLGQADGGGAVLATALALAGAFGGRVTVLHVRPDPAAMVPLVGEGMSGMMVEDLLEAARVETEARAEAVRALFEQTVEAHPDADLVFVDCDGREENEVIKRGRLSDLIVLARPGEDEDPSVDLTLNAAIMETGRPVLLAPPAGATSVGRRACVAWNGSLQAARAVGAALPVLAKAESVGVLVGEGLGDGGGLVDYLKSHGVTASAKALDAHGSALGAALLAEAEGCDLLVMGAYTHSRLRQFILGGVTHHVLENASLPVLVSH